MNCARARAGRPGPSQRRRLVARVVSAVAIATVVASGPAVIGYGLVSLRHDNDLDARGVPATAVVTGRIDGERGCLGSDVSYLTSDLRSEEGTIDDCLQPGDQVKVIYDPAEPNVVKLAREREDTAGGWRMIALGSVIIAGCLSLGGRSLWRRRRTNPTAAPASG